MRRLTILLFASALLLAPPVLAKPGASSSVTITASSARVVFGSSTLISGQVTGKKAAGTTVELQDEAAPAKSFSTLTTTTADAAGHYSFKVTPSANTTYRAIAKTAPTATSSNVIVKVLVKVTLRVSTTKPAVGHMVTFSGVVLPAYNGKRALIQQKTATGWKTVAKATLVATTPLGSIARSKYSKRIRFQKSGSYRVWFNPADNVRLPNSSPVRRLT